jgi:hypothetical protein
MRQRPAPSAFTSWVQLEIADSMHWWSFRQQ